MNSASKVYVIVDSLPMAPSNGEMPPPSHRPPIDSVMFVRHAIWSAACPIGSDFEKKRRSRYVDTWWHILGL